MESSQLTKYELKTSGFGKFRDLVMSKKSKIKFCTASNKRQNYFMLFCLKSDSEQLAALQKTLENNEYNSILTRIYESDKAVLYAIPLAQWPLKIKRSQLYDAQYAKKYYDLLGPIFKLIAS